jgi:hypothetical protein
MERRKLFASRLMPEHNRKPSQWSALFKVALELIDQASSNLGGYDIPWSFGGGTAMMLQIDHRESHDIDLFLEDPQFLGYFDPHKIDFDYSVMPSDYNGDGSRFQKFAFKDIGEIDFIVSSTFTSNPFLIRKIQGREIKLETTAEIIAKKIYFRGSEAKPRDIFDIAAAATTQRSLIVAALSSYKPQTQATLDRLSKLNPEFVDATIASLMIKPEYLSLIPECRAIAQSVLQEAMECDFDRGPMPG